MAGKPRARIGECKVCGDSFLAVNDYSTSRGSRSQEYCSKKCWSCRGRVVFICEGCEKEIITIKCRPRKYCSRECAHMNMVGEKAGRYKDGQSLYRDRARMACELKQWRESVFKRDKYTCQNCKNHGVKIHAHHIKFWAEYPQFRFQLSNGLTLCENCHGKIHGKDFSKRRIKKCPICGNETKGRGFNGRCQSCSIKIDWRRRKKYQLETRQL